MNAMLSTAKSNMKLKDQKSETIHIYKAATCTHTSYKAWQQVEQAPKIFMPWSLEPGKMLYSVEKGLCRYDLDYRHRIGRTLELVGGRRDELEGKLEKFQVWEGLDILFAHLKMRSQLIKESRWPQGAENGSQPREVPVWSPGRKGGRE